ncbi:Phosphotransferase system protein [Ignavibacterium album JCM 16511]|uniref:Phosphotransferase system protein n=1 Tax=Ignavibacterium album (strain DSM 19864 / JCM 16511 / NBRC 101810 / Mat9-16) TaxID=945713 RepID=I0AFY6_IGNAJ|nr:PTS sugar transporter subunit IIA [Ignavibacterium album]AFH47893.1 Phosphotransferase system protein [Ignavibacterium album JCM 16511]
MDALLDALQEGRLIELPDNDKINSLRFLSHILEAVPSVPANTDIAGLVLKREENINTALGKGIAVPHARVPFEGDLLCAVGWSPSGINYNAPDNEPVHIVIMYLVPINQRNTYLKEISNIARAMIELYNEKTIKTFEDLNDVRNYLLDIISNAKEIIGAEARARMIRLEIKDIETVSKAQPISGIQIELFNFISFNNDQLIILTQNPELLDLLEKNKNELLFLYRKDSIEINGWRIIKRAVFNYQANRELIECVAVKFSADSKN